MSKHYLLFQNLGYDFEYDLPIAFGNGVILDNYPYHALDQNSSGYTKRELYTILNTLLPMHTFPGAGINHCCLSIDSKASQLKKHDAGELFFTAITSLRLWKPLFINIAGGFEYVSPEKPLENIYYHHKASNYVNTSNGERYTKKDVMMAAKINRLLLTPFLYESERMKNSISFFSHVTNGLVYLHQFGYIGLFAALEALFPIKKRGDYSEQLSKYVAMFLSNKWDPEIIYKFIKDEYDKQRNPIAHGKYNYTFNQDRETRNNNFGFLHEIVRLTILGFLSMDEKLLKELLETKSTRLQGAMKEIGPAKGKFIDSQSLVLV